MSANDHTNPTVSKAAVEAAMNYLAADGRLRETPGSKPLAERVAIFALEIGGADMEIIESPDYVFGMLGLDAPLKAAYVQAAKQALGERGVRA